MDEKLIAISISGIISALTIGLAVDSVQAQTSLRWKFKEQDAFGYTIDNSIVSKSNMMGLDIENKINQAFDVSWKVEAVDESGKAKITLTVDRVRYSFDSPFGAFEYDSKEGKLPDDAYGKLLAPVLSAMHGSQITAKMDSLGVLSDAMSSDRVVRLLKANPTLAQLGPLFSEEGLRQVILQTFTVPGYAVGKGSLWNAVNQVKGPFGIAKSFSTLVHQGSETRDGVELEKIEMTQRETLDPTLGGTLEVRMKNSTTKGTYFFDNQFGRLHEMTWRQDQTLEVTTVGVTTELKNENILTMRIVKGPKED